MVADTVVVDTRRVYEAHRSSDPINIAIEGQESIFWVRPGARSKPGTTTKLYLRKADNPWQRMTEDQFISYAENVVPNPPFKISVETKSHKNVRDEGSFRQVKATSLKDHTWSEHENIREFCLELGDVSKGFVGSVVVAVLEHRGRPVSRVDMASKSVMVDDQEYELAKSLSLSGKTIQLVTSSITIDDNDQIEQSESTVHLANSRSKLSLHGIDVPTTLFPDWYGVQHNQVQLKWPLPLLLVVDICGERDLDLNSSRTQIIMSDSWLDFEEALSYEIALGIAKQVPADYWSDLKEVLAQQSAYGVFRGRLDEIEAVSPGMGHCGASVG
jgi:molecular chaperone HtpG